MSLLQNLQNKSQTLRNQENEIISEIVGYFREKLYSEEFETKFEQSLNEAEIRDRTVKSSIAFWNYQDGCSSTHFKVWKYYWENPEGQYSASRNYKGHSLYYLQQRIVTQLVNLFIDRMRDLGFQVEVENDTKPHLQYDSYKITIKW